MIYFLIIYILWTEYRFHAIKGWITAVDGVLKAGIEQIKKK